MPKSMLDWMGVVCLWIGSIVLAFKSAGAPLPAGGPPVLASGFWNFVPLVLVSIALLIFIYRQLYPITSALSAARAEPKSLATEIKADPPNETPQPPSTVERVYVGGTTSPHTLMALAEGKTNHEGQLVIAPFIGKWMRVEGIFDDLSTCSSFSIVSLQSRERVNILGVSLPDTKHTMFVFEEYLDRLEVLRVGEKIVIDGQITKVDRHHCKLEHCEIVQQGS